VNIEEKVMLAKMDSKLDNIDKKLDGHLSEHFKMRLVYCAFISTLIVSTIIAMI
jgi:hypothetical protein